MRPLALESVSVVIPTYNRGHCLAEAVLSVRLQTLLPTEIIIVDDASSDDTRQIVDSLKQHDHGVPIRYCRHSDNLGGGAARNTGVSRARGDIVAFLDSDDTWFPDKLERQCRVLEQAAHPNSTVVYGQVRIRKRGRTHALPARAKPEDTSVGDYWFLMGGMMQTSTLLLPRTLALAAPIDPDLRRHQDIYLCTELERLGARFEFVEHPVSEWNVRPSADRISTSPRVAPTIQFLERHGDRLSQAARRSFEARTLAPLLGQSGQRRVALGVLWAAVRDGVTSPRAAGFLLFRIVVPAKTQLWMKRLIARLLERSP